jgi:RNA-binding protein Musashi
MANEKNTSLGGAQEDNIDGKIFVGGISWQTTEESMRFHFEKFGEISSVTIMVNKMTGQPRLVSLQVSG